MAAAGQKAWQGHGQGGLVAGFYFACWVLVGFWVDVWSLSSLSGMRMLCLRRFKGRVVGQAGISPLLLGTRGPV